MSLLNKSIVDMILKDDIYASSHHARDDYFGAGILYYAFSYMRRPKICVCLGSGCGFVPKIMRQAQLDAGTIDGVTYLIDADMPEVGFGSPDYYKQQTHFTENFDVKIIKQKTVDSLSLFEKESIGYLHIDADHSYDGVKSDLESFIPYMQRCSVITMHDSIHRNCGVWKLIEEIRIKNEYDVVNLQIGTGLAVFMKDRI